jgi:hypothetical protein
LRKRRAKRGGDSLGRVQQRQLRSAINLARRPWEDTHPRKCIFSIVSDGCCCCCGNPTHLLPPQSPDVNSGLLKIQERRRRRPWGRY